MHQSGLQTVDHIGQVRLEMRLLILSVALAATACVGVQGATEEAPALSQELTTRVAGEPQTCIPAGSGKTLTVIDQRTLIAEQGDTIWVNRLVAACPGLQPFSNLIVQVQGSQYCRGDQIRALEPGLAVPGPICILRDFTPFRRRDDEPR
jgi:hypothetical protein